MKLLSYSQPVTPKPQPARFGMTPGVRAIDGSLRWLQANRTREMFFEDFVGFGVMRTLLDLGRQFFFKKGNSDAPKRELNFPAARERLIREVGSIITDNVSGGVIAYGLAKAWNKFGKTPNFSNEFISNQTMSLFEEAAKQSTSKKTFLEALAKQIDSTQVKPTAKMLEWATWHNPTSSVFNETAVSMTRFLKREPMLQNTLDVSINQSKFALNTLLEDASAFTRAVDKNLEKSGASWSKRAMDMLGQTAKVNKSRLIIGIGAAMGLTMAVPFINQYITRKIDQIESYPGELGLRKLKKVSKEDHKSFMARYFPYLNDSLKKGNVFPLLGSLVTLPFAFGMMDTNKLSAGDLKAALNLPPILPGLRQTWGTFFKRMGNMMQFGKGFPFTTQQQMAGCFAFLIFSRLITARSDIEYRERMVDSFLGWSIWILATPFLKRQVAKVLDPNLLKGPAGQQVLKSRFEIERLLPEAIKKSALSKYILLSAGSLGITLLLMGLVEPLIAIKWTERQSKKAV